MKCHELLKFSSDFRLQIVSAENHNINGEIKKERKLYINEN